MLFETKAVSRFVPENNWEQSDINTVSSTHVETVCILVRRNSLYIDIDVDEEEMLQEKHGQATYP